MKWHTPALSSKPSRGAPSREWIFHGAYSRESEAGTRTRLYWDLLPGMVRTAGLRALVSANWTRATQSAEESAHGAVWLLGLESGCLSGWEQQQLQVEMRNPGNPGERPALSCWPEHITTPLDSGVRMGHPHGPGSPINTTNSWHAIPGHLWGRGTASQTQGEASRRGPGAGHSHISAPTGSFQRRERKSRNHQLSKWHTVGPQGPP